MKVAVVREPRTILANVGANSIPREARMRKKRNGFWRGLRATVLTMIAAAALAGCTSGPSPKETLGAAYKELEGPNPNYAQMSVAADEYIKAQPTGPALADAYYLKGRALEEKAQRD